MSSINIRLTHPILPEGATIDAELDLARGLDTGLKALATAIDAAYEQSDKSRDTSPGERKVAARLEAIEKSIVQGLPVEVRLDIANKSTPL